MTDLERHQPPTAGSDVDTLRYLGLDPDDVASRALVLVAGRYQLDPLLGEICLIVGRGGKAQVYVTRDGLVALAHRSGQLDGIVVDEMRRNTSNDGWTAYVSVYRKDCGHPFKYGAQCKDTEPQAKAGNGLEQAVARAERRALKRAFAVTAADGPPSGGVAVNDRVDVDGDAYELADPGPVDGEAAETS